MKITISEFNDVLRPWSKDYFKSIGRLDIWEVTAEAGKTKIEEEEKLGLA